MPDHRWNVAPSRVDVVIEALNREHLGWIIRDLEPYPPSTTHGEHKYEGSCAICRASDRSEALEHLVEAVLGLDDLSRAALSGATSLDPSSSNGPDFASSVPVEETP